MEVRCAVGIPRDHSKDYCVWRMFRTGKRGRHGVCADKPLGAAAPYSGAAAGLNLRGQVDVDFMKKGKKLFPLKNFW